MEVRVSRSSWWDPITIKLSHTSHGMRRRCPGTPRKKSLKWLDNCSPTITMKLQHIRDRMLSFINFELSLLFFFVSLNSLAPLFFHPIVVDDHHVETQVIKSQCARDSKFKFPFERFSPLSAYNFIPTGRWSVISAFFIVLRGSEVTRNSTDLLNENRFVAVNNWNTTLFWLLATCCDFEILVFFA